MTDRTSPLNSSPRTLHDIIFDSHAIMTRPDGATLLHVDRHIVHDAMAQAFDMLAARGLSVRRPGLTLGTADHYVATGARTTTHGPDHESMVTRLAMNSRRWAFPAFGPGDGRQGIVHVVGPEQGFTLPGAVLVCGDSHTATHGALGALAFGIGTSEVAHVLATQTVWQRRPRQMRVTIHGQPGPHVSAKDIVLALIARIGAGGGTGHAIEYAGPAIRALSVEARMTICNMSIEAGARIGMIAPDDTTLTWLAGRTWAPKGRLWDHAVEFWRDLSSHPEAVFDREISLDASAIAPTVTWGTSPEDALPIDARVPDPEDCTDPAIRRAITEKLAYMGLRPGEPIAGLPVQRVFIGSCTNSRIEDLRAAAAIARHHRAKVPTQVSPGSAQVKAQAESEGLDIVFRKAGFDWTEPGCSMCVAMNGDIVPMGMRCASTSNRNFAGRQGQGSRTHLLGPAMAAAAAVTGRLVDVRRLAGGAAGGAI